MDEHTEGSMRTDASGHYASATEDPAENGRAAMLRMARSWGAAGQINQAIALYHQLLVRHPHTMEAQEAAEALLRLAHGYEEQGKYHLALGLYDLVDGRQ